MLVSLQSVENSVVTRTMMTDSSDPAYEDLWTRSSSVDGGSVLVTCSEAFTAMCGRSPVEPGAAVVPDGDATRRSRKWILESMSPQSVGEAVSVVALA